MLDINKEICDELNKNLDKQEEIRKKIEVLPKGRINFAQRGKLGYYYRTYREGDKVKRTYVGKSGHIDLEAEFKKDDLRDELNEKLEDLKDEEKELRRSIKKLGIKNFERTIYTIYELKKAFKPILKKYGIDIAFLFGSYSRGEATEKSDIDIIVKLEKNKSEFEKEIRSSVTKDIDILYSGTKASKYFIEEFEKDKIKL